MWNGRNYEPAEINQFVVWRIGRVNEKIYVAGKEGEVQIYDFEKMELLHSRNLALENPILCSKENS